jgi:hypothetical protein
MLIFALDCHILFVWEDRISTKTVNNQLRGYHVSPTYRYVRLIRCCETGVSGVSTPRGSGPRALSPGALSPPLHRRLTSGHPPCTGMYQRLSRPRSCTPRSGKKPEERRRKITCTLSCALSKIFPRLHAPWGMLHIRCESTHLHNPSTANCIHPHFGVDGCRGRRGWCTGGGGCGVVPTIHTADADGL